MDRTCILEPLTKDVDKKQVHKDNYSKILKELNSFDHQNDLTFEQFLKKSSLSKEEYIAAIRSSLSRTQVFLLEIFTLSVHWHGDPR